MKAQRSSYRPRYEGNGCGGAKPKSELSANTIPAKVPAAPKQEGGAFDFDHNAIVRLVSAMQIDSDVKKLVYEDIPKLLMVAATARNAAEYKKVTHRFRIDTQEFLTGDPLAYMKIGGT